MRRPKAAISAFISNNLEPTRSNSAMNKFFAIPVAVALALLVSCGKQQTEAEKNAEIERQVQQRLDAEHQAETQKQLNAREADLATREKALADQQNAPVAAEPPAQVSAPRNEPTTEENREAEVATNGNASYDTFYTKLDPYGDWRETAEYGYVFQPRAAEGSRKWRPYTNGRWVYTDAGWTWVSEEPFGWATYHYGRWTRLRQIGWVWVPGDEWAPAWVSWRKSDDYVGWAPLPPEATFDRRAGIHQWADNNYDLGPEEYAFVSTNEFGSRRMEQTVVPEERNVTIVSQTTNVTSITYNNTMIVNQGPSYEDLSRRSRQPIERLHLERGAQVEGDNPRAIVRGEIISMPAPSIAPAQRPGRPARVKEAISNAIVDHGAAENVDRAAAENARAKMRAESTPPVGLPPKKFVKPAVSAPPVAPQWQSDVFPKATSTPVRNIPDNRGRESDEQRLREEAQRRAAEERKVKQTVKPTEKPSASVPASPASTPPAVALPISPARASHTPLPEATVSPAGKPVQNPANPPVQKRVPVSPPPLAARPSPIIAPPTEPETSSSPAKRIKATPRRQPSATASPSESAASEPGDDGKKPAEHQ